MAARLVRAFTTVCSIACLMLIAIGGPGVSRALALQWDDAPERLSLSAAWEQADPVAGTTPRLAVVMDLMEKWHIYPGKGSPDELQSYIATEITLDLPVGWSAGAIQWPKAHDFNFLGEMLRVYDGRAVAFVPIAIPENADPRTYTIGVTVRYQACDDQLCEMPTSASVDSTINVRAAGSDVTPPQDALARSVFGLGDGAAGGGDDAAILKLKSFDDGEAKRATVRLAWEMPKQVAMGSKENPARLAVIVDIEDTWHFWPYEQTGEESMYPTIFKVEVPDGWTVLEDEIRWPESHEIEIGALGFQGEERAYEGRIVTIVPIVIPESTQPGTYPVTVEIEYQACDPEVCEPPATVIAETKAEVVATASGLAGVPVTPPAIAELFREQSDDAVKAGGAGDGPGTAGGTGGTPAGAAGTSDQPAAGAANAPEVGPKTEMEYMWIAFAILAAAMGWMFGQTLRITKNAGYRVTVGVAATVVIVSGFLLVRSMTQVPPVDWVTWSPEKFEELRNDPDQEQAILVKFTADWCVNCKVIERTTLAQPEVIRVLNSPGVVAMKADLTGNAPEGWAAVRALGSGGIPLTAVYHPGIEEPIVFRSFYTEQSILSAVSGEQAGVVQASFDFFGMRFNASGFVVIIIAAIAGFFLNFTPCVLPVVPLKILSLQAHAKDPARCLFLGTVFAAGIVAFFLVLGGVIAGLRGAFDWGQMFSYWPVNLTIGLIIAIMGLGMFNMFSIRLPQVAYMFNPQSDSASGSFLMGVFTAVLSTPCTGPLLGAAIAWVLTQSWMLALLIFLAMGVGMAFPYVLLTAVPKWLDKLPRTGPGSELIKQVMGLLMIAVSVYFIGIAITGMQGPAAGSGEAPAASVPAPATTQDGGSSA